MRIHTSHWQNDRVPTPPVKGPLKPDSGPLDLYYGGDEIRSGLTVMVGVSAVGAAAGLASGYVHNPVAKAALGSFAGASGGLTAANFVPRKPFLALGLVGAVAGGVVALKFQHPLATGILTLAGATLPAGLILGLMDGFE